MATFKYQARRASGGSIEGLVEAPNQEIASNILKDKDLIVISIKEKITSGLIEKFLDIFNGIKGKDLVFFARQLAVMLQASVPVVKALRVLSKQTSNKALKLIVADIAFAVDSGTKLSQALAKYPNVFDNFFVSMIKAGETTGRLDKVLVYLADQIEKDYNLRSRIRGAMIYPIFILSVLILMGVLMMIFVVPKFVDVLSSSNVELPWTTKLLIAFSDFLVHDWWLLLFIIIIFGVSFYLFNKNPAGHYYVDLLKIKMPIIGPINWKTYMARFGQSLSSLLTSGVPLTKSLQISSEIVNNEVYSRIIMKAAREVEVGKTISSVFLTEKEIPLLVTNMISVGEETGRLDTVLKKVADFYTDETEVSIRTLISLIEPIILILMALAAGGLVVSIIMPMYKLTESFA
jgi:type IV pilus assembly protein PilC